MTILDRDATVAAVEAAFDGFVDLAESLAADEWTLPTDCPGWTVQDVVSHIIGTEAMMLGRPAPDVALPDDLPHVHNDIGRFNEQWAEHYRARPPAEVLADLREVVAERRRALADTDQAAFDEESFTPAGPDTYGRMMRIRVMDIWLHDQDIRLAVGRPGHLTGPAPTAALDEIAHIIGYVVGKRAAVPAGRSVRFELTGPLSRRIDVEVGDRARVVDHLAGEPTVTLTMAGDHFTRLVGGRGATPDVVVDGDPALGTAVVDNLAIMI
ncbi:MAG TPA: maleylpyruvate isomerase family mycothiol-dependent enzyme [Acidimicrobiales bacterium]|nr:maleylpyruvate isomerase family mycothiol-dependent enzyme [Acidimicrobiales bacterium]